MALGYEISHLLNFVSKEYNRVSFHGTEARIIRMQAEFLGTPLLQKKTTVKGYEKEFRDAVRSLLPKGVKGMVFGDIFIQGHKDWIENVCGELGLDAVEPLWGRKTEDVLSEFIDAGFEAVVASAQAKFIDREWLGRKVDREFMEYLKSKNIDVCGENGQYHTIVTDGPIFKKRIKILETRTIERDGYWFLDTRRYHHENKAFKVV